MLFFSIFFIIILVTNKQSVHGSVEVDCETPPMSMTVRPCLSVHPSKIGGGIHEKVGTVVVENLDGYVPLYCIQTLYRRYDEFQNK